MNAILGYERFTRDYWASTSPALPLFERIELMWRLEIIRHAPVDTAMWQELATQGECLLQQGDYLTIWMHHWIGWPWPVPEGGTKHSSSRHSYGASRGPCQRLLVHARR